MKKLQVNAVRLIVFALFGLFAVIPLQAQDTVTITLSDLQNFRKAVNDAIFWEKTSKDKEDQIKAANDSAASWKGLYLSEKDRADRVQEKRAVEATAAANDFKEANFELRSQNTELKREKRDLEDDVTSLKSGRKWYFTAGAATGAVAGFFGGRATCGVSIPGLARSIEQTTDVYYRSPFYRKPEMPSPLRPASEFLKKQF